MTANFVSLSKKMESKMEAIRLAIGRAAQDTGVDFSYLMAQARSESGLNPHAKAQGSSATGLFQFLDQSWLGVLKQHGDSYGYGWASDAITKEGGRWVVSDASLKSQIFALREDPSAAACMAGAFAADNAETLAQCLGRPASRGELYFAHFLGASGASRFLTKRAANGNACAASHFQKEAKANPAIFYDHHGRGRSFDEVFNLLSSRLDHNATGSDSVWEKTNNLHYASYTKPVEGMNFDKDNRNFIAMAMNGIDGLTAAAMLSHRPNTKGHSSLGLKQSFNTENARLAYTLIASKLSNNI
ncbi:MAG: transglycosylase SLT domain-containing protein [Zymomonas mobilis subsp. pomaceae]|uniref:transglycosylase SLT domain-containing protein n=1 Tax=Zymomonas mobilis TaxID=542 RepID=UPI0039E7C769